MTSKWTAHNQSTIKNTVKDFKKTNKMAIKQRATTAKSQSAFRRSVYKELPTLNSRMGQRTDFLPEEEYSYGKPNRPGTPVGDVISNYYGQNAEK